VQIKTIKLSAAMLAALTIVTAGATATGTLAQSATMAATMAAGPIATAKPGQAVNFLMLPKNVGNPVFALADQGAQEAAAELKSTGKYQFNGPDKPDVQGQISLITSGVTQGVNAIGANADDAAAIVPALKDAMAKNVKIVGWDSPPNVDGRNIFIAPVDFSTAGQVMADMALDILGANGGKFAVLSATADAANQNAWIASLKDTLKNNPKYAKLTLLDVVYGNDDNAKSYTEAQGLVDKYPDIQLIMAPTTVGIAAAAKAMQDGKLCDKVKVSGLGLAGDMVSYTKNGCAPEFALWSFIDLGYLTYYTGYMLATGAIKGNVGESFTAGRMGNYTIQKDTNDDGTYLLMGPFTVFNKANIDKFVSPAPAATMAATAAK
jgi:rhamnose transport system substrate-binding protein